MANSWYRTGTVTVTNGSATVSGAGTLFLANINAGDTFFAPDGVQYEVVTVPDNVTLTIKQKNGTAAYLGSTLGGQTYSIIKTGPNNATVATQLTTLATSWQQDRDQYANWLGGTATGGDGAGNYPLTDALGVSHNVPCPAKVALMPTQALLTGYVKAPGTITAADTVLSAINKLMPLTGSAGQAVTFGAVTAAVSINTHPTLTYGSGGSAVLEQGSVQIAFGTSSTAPYPSWMQCRLSDNTAKDLLINPLGGNVLIGSTASLTGGVAKCEINGGLYVGGNATIIGSSCYGGGSYLRLASNVSSTTSLTVREGNNITGTISGIDKITVSSTGLAVTGGISATGVSAKLQLISDYPATVAPYVGLTSAGNIAARLMCATTGLVFGIDAVDGTTEHMKLTTSGLAVTGGITASALPVYADNTAAAALAAGTMYRTSTGDVMIKY